MRIHQVAADAALGILRSGPLLFVPMAAGMLALEEAGKAIARRLLRPS